MALHKDDFLCEDDLDCVLAITDADLFGNDEDMESEIVTCIKSLPSSKIALSNASLSKTLSIQSRFIKAREGKTSTVHCPW